MMMMMNKRKNQRLVAQNIDNDIETNETKESSMERLLEDHADVAETIWAYLPPGYRYVAGVSRTFRNVYGCRCCGGTTTGHRGTTSVEWAMASPQTAAIFVKECRPDDDDEDDDQIVTRHKACTYAARYGRLATLMWLRDETIHDPLWPWDSSTLIAAAAAAARAGAGASSRECLDYAIDHGCPWILFAGRQWGREEGQDDPLSDLVKFVDWMVVDARLMKRFEPVFLYYLPLQRQEQHPALVVVPPVVRAAGRRWDAAAVAAQRRRHLEPGAARRRRRRRRRRQQPPRGDDRQRRQQRHLPPPKKRGGQQRPQRPQRPQQESSKGQRR